MFKLYPVMLCVYMYLSFVIPIDVVFRCAFVYGVKFVQVVYESCVIICVMYFVSSVVSQSHVLWHLGDVCVGIAKLLV